MTASSSSPTWSAPEQATTNAPLPDPPPHVSRLPARCVAPSCPVCRAAVAGPGFWTLYQDTVRGDVVRGNLVPDAHIAALMRQHGVATIWTADRDSKRFRVSPRATRTSRRAADWHSRGAARQHQLAHPLGVGLATGGLHHGADDRARRGYLAAADLGRDVGLGSQSLFNGGGQRRSEEHTSELQSRQYLVCRLLL